MGGSRGSGVAFSIGTYQRSQLWAGDVRLWQDTAEKSPGKARPWTWLGRIYIERGKYVLALQALEKGEQVAEPRSPEQAHLFSDIGLAYANMKQYPEAIDAYRRAIEMLPNEPLFQAHLAVALIHGGRKEEGWQEFERLSRQPKRRRGGSIRNCFVCADRRIFRTASIRRQRRIFARPSAQAG